MDSLKESRLKLLLNHERYVPTRYINEGGYGFVIQAYDKKWNQWVAIKFLSRQRLDPKYVKAEIINHKQLYHPHVVQFVEAFLIEQYLCIAMEYVPNGDLWSFLRDKKRLSETEARWYFQQLIIAVDYCHKMGISNRDIKLENTLLGDDHQILKICDFGYSKSDDWQTLPKTQVGTTLYMAPEVLDANSTGRYNGKKADVWSCGVILYIMVYGIHPFQRDGDDRQNNFAMTERIVKSDFVFYPNIPVSEEFKDLISRMFQLDAANRVSMNDIQEHPWYNVGLPEGVADLNAKYLSRKCPRGLQTSEEIEILLDNAKTMPMEIH